jgi:hypothetical protein
MFVAFTETQDTRGGETLHVDHFGLSIGSVSVGLPPSCTGEYVYVRYLDLMRLLQRGPVTVITASQEDLKVLSAATRADCDVIARRLAAIQR